MKHIIIDMGSGNTCQNDKKYIKKMIDELNFIDAKNHRVTIKWQLFNYVGENTPLLYENFKYAFDYAKTLGYSTTASVFDRESLSELLKYNVPFIKISNNPDYRYLVDFIPRGIDVYGSLNNNRNEVAKNMEYIEKIEQPLCCISKYPATLEDYEAEFNEYQLSSGISDHTKDFELYFMYEPDVYEVHYKLDDSIGLDAGPFAKTPTQLKEILG